MLCFFMKFFLHSRIAHQIIGSKFLIMFICAFVRCWWNAREFSYLLHGELLSKIVLSKSQHMLEFFFCSSVIFLLHVCAIKNCLTMFGVVEAANTSFSLSQLLSYGISFRSFFFVLLSNSKRSSVTGNFFVSSKFTYESRLFSPLRFPFF